MQTRRTSPARSFLLLDDEALMAQCDVGHFQDSGPGGQKRNRKRSAVRLHHRPTGVVAGASDNRSQRVNTLRALRRLRLAIALEIRTERDMEAYEPGPQLAERVAGGKLTISRRHRLYPAVVAEVLDVLVACRARVSVAAKHIGVSTANLVKFIRSDPKLTACVNAGRAKQGLKPLR